MKDIRPATPRRSSAEDKIRIVLEGLRGDDSIAGSCQSSSTCEAMLASGYEP